MNKNDQYIIDNYLTVTKVQLCKDLGLTKAVLNGYFKRLGLKLPADLIIERKAKGSFKKGHSPVNKGKKQSDFLSAEQIEKIKKTQFKKGQRPYNCYGEVGKITLRKDKRGVIYKFICLEVGKWDYLHRHLWREANGEIPSKHVVRFKDGDQLNCVLENLELISMKDNRLKNSGPMLLTESYLVKCIVGRKNKIDPNILLENKEIIAAKKNQLLLNRKIKKHGTK
ncbi:MAG: HNH endonuclease [Sphingobacteriaceae bacterium]|nr:HNH endonuclease [Sphingobacteriaceae bacterium]